MILTWLGHACFALESGAERVILDPFKGVPGFADAAGEADAVYCSHGHFDHCYTEHIRIRAGGASRFSVREVKSFHDDAGGAKRGGNTIRILTAEGITVVHLGDLGHPLSAEQISDIGACDVLLLPTGGTYTVDAAAAKKVADAIAPRVIVPMHYRRGEQGFEVLQTVEEFAAQFAAEEVHWLEGNCVALSDEVLARGGVVVPKYQ